MNKVSVLVAIATLSLAAPALAQTPSDIRNGRPTVAPQSSPEVKLDRNGNSYSTHQTNGSTGTQGDEAGSMHHHGKHHGKHAGKHHHKHAGKKHHGKKHHKSADKAADKAAPADAGADTSK